LQFRNPDFVLMFRGQNTDYLNHSRNTALKPTLFRPSKGTKMPPKISVLVSRYKTLASAEKSLVHLYRVKGMKEPERLERHRMLRWAILQHYEVCPTPLLDITHSLRIAASFATKDATQDAFVFVLAIPNLSGAITASAEAGIQIIRLASVCPPEALRPHIQEGYLVGEYPDLVDPEQKALFKNYEIDFGRRLIAKFRFIPKEFWKDENFPEVPQDALYPNSREDKLWSLTEGIKISQKL